MHNCEGGGPARWWRNEELDSLLEVMAETIVVVRGDGRDHSHIIRLVGVPFPLPIREVRDSVQMRV